MPDPAALQQWPIARLKEFAGNPRKNDHAVDAAAKAIKQFGFRVPILAKSDGLIIDGHLRLKAARQLGLDTVPVLLADDLTEAQVKAFRLSVNKIADLAEWGADLLAFELDGLRDMAFDMDAIGFAPGELNDLIGTPNTGFDPDEVPPAPVVPVSRTGDLWRMGDHRLLCGDSTKAEDVARLMGGAKADIFQTDPPYLVDYTGGDRPNNSGKDWSSQYHEVDIKDAATFFRAVFTCASNVAKDDAAWYCWHAHKRAAEIEAAWASLDVLNHQQIVWVKPTALHGFSFWPYQHEPCLMGWKKGHKPRHDGDNSHAVTTVWSVDWNGKSRVVGNEHPTQKPVELFAIPYRKHTRPGDIGFEPFCGSGSQLIAAEQLGRRCFAMELEPVFVDVTINRWIALTGKQATLDADGRTFEEVKRERTETATVAGQ